MPTSDYQIDYIKDAMFVHISDHEGNQVAISHAALHHLVDDLLHLLYPNLPPREAHTIAAPDADYDALCDLGKEWIKTGNRRREDMHRIYFDTLQGWYGLLIQPDRTATFRGQPCTRDEAVAIIGRFTEAKVYFDVLSKTFHGTKIGREDFEFIIEQIRTLEREDT